jgi:hypothetical protein
MSAIVDIPFFSRNTSQNFVQEAHLYGSFDEQLDGDILLDHRLPNMGLDAAHAIVRRPTSPPSPCATLALGGDPFNPDGSSRAEVNFHSGMARRRATLRNSTSSLSSECGDAASLTSTMEASTEAGAPEEEFKGSVPPVTSESTTDEITALSNDVHLAQHKVHELRRQLQEQMTSADARLRTALYRAQTTTTSTRLEGAAV